MSSSIFFSRITQCCCQELLLSSQGNFNNENSRFSVLNYHHRLFSCITLKRPPSTFCISLRCRLLVFFGEGWKEERFLLSLGVKCGNGFLGWRGGNFQYNKPYLYGYNWLEVGLWSIWQNSSGKKVPPPPNSLHMLLVIRVSEGKNNEYLEYCFLHQF